MKRFLFIVASAKVFAASCCGGSGPKSFIQLNHLQNYEFAVASSLKDGFGRYNSYGELVGIEKQTQWQLAFGAGIRITENLETFGVLPLVRSVRQTAGETREANGLGDLSVGFRLHVLDSLYDDDWYPDVKLIASVGAPTGRVEHNDAKGSVVPGTGNGYWETLFGVQLERDFGWVMLSFVPAYSFRFSRNVMDPLNGSSVSVREGNKLTLSFSAVVPVSQRFSFHMGGGTSWVSDRKRDEKRMPDTDSRVATGFGGLSYFISRFWVLNFTAETTLPWERGGMNEPASRIFSLTSNYAIY